MDKYEKQRNIWGGVIVFLLVLLVMLLTIIVFKPQPAAQPAPAPSIQLPTLGDGQGPLPSCGKWPWFYYKGHCIESN